MTDPNWLPATLAQSAAALVAIIGGFLVSRVVALAAEKNGLERRENELEIDLTHRRSQLDPVRSQRLGEDRALFKQWALDDIVEARGRPELPALIHEHMPRAATTAEMAEVAESLAGEVRQAFADIEAVLQDGEVVYDVDDLRSHDLEIPRESEELYELVLGKLWTERHPMPVAGLDPAVLSNIGSSWDQFHAERYEQLVHDEQALAAQVSALEAELQLVRTELARFTRPTAFWPGLAVLAYFAVVGIIAPVLVISSEPAGLGTSSRVWLVIGFSSGLLALIAYLAWSVHGLGTEQPPEDDEVADKEGSTGA